MADTENKPHFFTLSEFKRAFYTLLKIFLPSLLVIAVAYYCSLKELEERKEHKQSLVTQAEKQRRVPDSRIIYMTKQGLEKRLKDGNSAQYRLVHVYHHPDKMAVCGEVNAKNSFGGYTGYQPFIGLGDLVVMPADMAAGEFQTLNRQVCR